MKRGCAFSFVVLLALLVAMCVTCPSEADHRMTINTAFRGAVKEKIGGHENELLGTVMDVVGGSLLEKTGDVALGQLLQVDDYVLFSVGRLKIGAKERVVSVGVFNHVFAPDKDDVLKVMKRYGF
jgi:hypothetical protein